MKTLRFLAWLLGAAVLALLWVELGLRGAALAWRPASLAGSRPGPFAVYVVGESTAYGEPYAPAISFPRILSMMFGGRLGGQPLEIVNLAQPGSNTEDQYWKLLQELSLRPRKRGIILVYAGINEAFPLPAPSAWRRLAERSWLISRLSFNRRQARKRGPDLDYEYRLGRLLALARGRGYPVVLSTLAGNVRDFQPDVARQLRGDSGRAAAFERALREEERRRWLSAAAIYEELAAGDPDPGVIHREAVCRLALGQTRRARELFQRAVDRGGALRPTTAQDQAIRRLARRWGAALADSRAAFEAASPQGLPGYDLFCDAHHPNLRGYLVLAASFAREVSRVLGEPVARPGLTEAEVREEAGFAKSDEQGVSASRFLWFCGESFHRRDPRETLRMARHYLELLEKGRGRSLPAYRFLLALVARDRKGLERVLRDRDALRRDREALGTIGCNPEWTRELVREAGLPEPLRGEAQGVMDLAARLSACGRGGAPSPQRRRHLASKKRADRGVSLVLSGRGEDGRRELEAALRMDPENAEAAASLCAWHSRQEAWETAWPYCDLAWRAAQAGEGGHPEAFVEQCRVARETAGARLKTRNPPLGGSGS
jgi:tetratricopeptide (TPR) repeat protein